MFISDDCSIDNTLEIIKKISKKNKNIFLWENQKKSKSATQKFFKLLTKVNFDKYDYISLSDQDDLWKKDKLLHFLLNLLYQE